MEIRPVWLENTILRMSYICVNTSHTFLPVSCNVLGSSRGDCASSSYVVSLAFVDHTFFRVCFMCPFGVSVVSG